MKYLININTKQILKEAKSIGQKWVESQDDLELIDLDDAVLENGSFRALTDADLKQFLLETANNKYEQEIIALGETIPDKEETTFPIQRAEAYAWILDNSFETPFIDGMLETREKYQNNKAGLVAKIIAKSKYYSYEAGKRTGARQDIEDKLEG